MASVTLQNVHKQYGKVHAVRGISIDVKDGEFIALLGPSGCGKSSTMRMIAGLEEITSGDILFNNSSVLDKKPSQRNVAMAFENYALYPTLTVYENLAFPLRSKGVHKAEIDIKVNEIAKIVGIEGLLDRKPGQLSSGQSQAISLARALIRNPNVFLLDEPISHLDTSQRFHMRVYIKRLHIELRYTMILVTHDQEDAMTLADRIAIMSDGVFHQVDTPRNIYDHPADLFVAGFIGDLPMNFLDGHVISENGKIFLQHQDIKIQIPDHFTQKASLPEDLVLGIRPYYVSIDTNSTVYGKIPCEIFVVELLGDTTVATVKIAEKKFQVVTPLSYRAKPGENVSISLNISHACFFDKKTGKAIQNFF